MRQIIMICFVWCNVLSAQEEHKKIGLTALVSNTVRDEQVGWLENDNESFDNFNVKNQSYAIGLLATYKISESNIRLRLNYTRIEIEEYQNYYLSGTYFSTTFGAFQNKISIALGITWNLINKKINFYSGFELPINLNREFKILFSNTETDSLTGNLLYASHGNQEIPPGFTIGLGGIFGFNYFIKPYFSIGSEFSPSLLFAKKGGSTTGNIYYTAPPPGSSISFSTNDEMRGYTFAESRFSFGITFWF